MKLRGKDLFSITCAQHVPGYHLIYKYHAQQWLLLWDKYRLAIYLFLTQILEASLSLLLCSHPHITVFLRVLFSYSHLKWLCHSELWKSLRDRFFFGGGIMTSDQKYIKQIRIGFKTLICSHMNKIISFSSGFKNAFNSCNLNMSTQHNSSCVK